MARNNEDTAPADTPATTEAPAAAATEDSRFITLNVPEGDPSGLSGSVRRSEYIKTLAKTGEWTRGDIAKHVTKLQFPNGGGKVAYQIVFQATKGIPNVKAAPRNTEAAPVETPAA